jgi:hypothetical protein
MPDEFAKWEIKTSVFSGRKSQDGNYCRRVKIADGKVHVAKEGQVLIRQPRPGEEKARRVTFPRAADGKWSVALIVELEMPAIPRRLPARQGLLGSISVRRPLQPSPTGNRSLLRSSSARGNAGFARPSGCFPEGNLAANGRRRQRSASPLCTREMPTNQEISSTR